MSVWTTPTTRSTGLLVTASIWNTDIVNNLIYLKTAPVFDTAVIIGAATTAGVRLDLESGTLAVREGDDSAYAPMITSVVNLPSGGSINFASGDVTITHSANTLTFAGATSYVFNQGVVEAGSTRLEEATAFLSNSGNTMIGWSSGISGYTNGSLILQARSSAAAPIVFVTGTTTGLERMQISSSGNVGVGMTPTYRLDVTAGAGAVAARFNQATTGKTGFIIAENLNTIAIVGQVGLYTGNSDQNFGIFAETGYDFQVATNGSSTTKFRVTTGGNIGINATARLYLDGSAGTGDTYFVESSNNRVELVVGLQRKIFAGYQTQSVGTTATTILADAEFFGSLVVVTGNEFLTSNSFCDVVMASRNVAPTVVVTYNSNGSPTARTYSRSGNALQLAMAANTYLVSTTALS